MLTADLQGNVVRALVANQCLSAVGLAEGTGAATYKTAATATYLSNGLHKTKAATDNVAVSAGHGKLLSGYTQLFVVGLDDAGTFSTHQGLAFKAETDVTGATKYRGYLTDTNGAGGATRHTKTGTLADYMSQFLPTSVPDTVTPVGVIKIVATADFTPGTTDFGSQDTCVDVGVLPARCNF